MHRTLFRAILLFLLLISCKNLFANNRILNISGLRIYTEEKLLSRLNMGKTIPPGKTSEEIISSIIRFYKNQGYPLVKIYVIENSRDRLSIYIDEGKLGKIIFLNLDTLRVLKLKLRYKFDKGIYNTKRLKAIIKSLKRKEGYGRISYKLKKTKNYDASLFQLDRELNLPVIGKSQLPFFDRFGTEYDLLFYISALKKGTKSGSFIDYKLKTDYFKGFIPRIRFYRYGLLQKEDRFEAGSSLGIMYGFDRKFGRLPYITFHKIDFIYKTAPIFTRYFTPFIKSVSYGSRASRKDLGLLKYNYLIVKSDFAPGITFLKKFEIYTGLGIENSIIFGSEIDPDKNPNTNIREGINRYPYIEAGFKFSRLPFYIWAPVKQKINITYYRYYSKKSFNKFNLKGESHFAYGEFTVHIIKLNYSRVWNKPPFYHEIPVSNGNFKGFMGRSFYSRHIFAFSNEIRTSIYKDFVFVGIFVDNVIFRGSGYDLAGNQYGITAGPTVRFLILSQFTMYIYYGRDFLISTEESQNNISFGLFKKW